MAKKKSQWASVGKREVELTNLDKVLFPEDQIVKAEVIEYYLKIAPTLLNHVKGRSLTLIRYPDGITGESFYQKNRPEWAPDWIEFVTLGKEKKDYIVATETALLVWLANLASIEIHQLHSRKPNFDSPDYMVFDLDPPEGYTFKKIIPIALDLKTCIESHGYTPFVKTTGGKGLHICCPIEPKWDFHTVFEAAQDIAKPFVDQHPQLVTLQLKKDARKGRVLIDIFRIRPGQSIVSPYSLRGRNGAPVSMPITWDELKNVESPLEFNTRTAINKVMREGDAWEGFDAYAVVLHTKRTKLPARKKVAPSGTKHKSPAQLEAYAKKRDFNKTPEPAANTITESGNRFVVHRHHASRLHYDLRLEQDGVLKSWALPKGLPPYPGVKRLAVQTEDHPMEYLTFDGKIPKGQYGAGEMWIYAFGKYQITKEKKDGFYFRLNSREVNGEYRIYKTKEKDWLFERVDEPQLNYLRQDVLPMLSEIGATPGSDEYIFEIKWDGIRAFITLEDDQIAIKSRNQNDITLQFPELQIGSQAFRATNGLFDAEIVCLDDEGKPIFKRVINRLMSSGAATIEKLSKTNPIHCYIFDCLYLDGRSLINEPLLKRKEWLKDAIRADTPYRFSEHVEDGESLFNAAKLHALEGIMAKRKDSKYLPGKRNDSWIKVKVRQSTECMIVGYTKGKGNRDQTFGALHIAERTENGLQYRGKVGTGFNDKTIKEVLKVLKNIKEVKKPAVKGKLLDEKMSTWLESKIAVEVSYSMLTSDKMFREPVFIRLRPDLS